MSTGSVNHISTRVFFITDTAHQQMIRIQTALKERKAELEERKKVAKLEEIELQKTDKRRMEELEGVKSEMESMRQKNQELVTSLEGSIFGSKGGRRGIGG